MLNRLRNLFRPKQASQSPELAPSGSIFVIAATDRRGIDANSLSKDAVLAAIRETLERDKENQKSSYSFFTYDVEGKLRLPFFTTRNYAENFCAKYSIERNRVFPFMVLNVSASLLGQIASGAYDQIVMNDKSPDEKLLTEDEREAAKELWPK